MNNYFQELMKIFEIEIDELQLQINCPFQRIEATIHLIIECLSKLKKYVIKKGFKDISEEIYFFKYQKPLVVSKLIYYNDIFKIETRKPNGSKAVKKYLNDELKKLKSYFDENIEFYKYYRTNSSFIDDSLFVRAKYNIKLNLDTVYFDSDHRFSTSHDYKVAKIIANELLQIYLEEQLKNNNPKKKMTTHL